MQNIHPKPCLIELKCQRVSHDFLIRQIVKPFQINLTYINERLKGITVVYCKPFEFRIYLWIFHRHYLITLYNCLLENECLSELKLQIYYKLNELAYQFNLRNPSPINKKIILIQLTKSFASLLVKMVFEYIDNLDITDCCWLTPGGKMKSLVFQTSDKQEVPYPLAVMSAASGQLNFDVVWK